MKIILLSGFLGAGKTSVLLQLARYLTVFKGADTLGGNEVLDGIDTSSSNDARGGAGALGTMQVAFQARTAKVAILENEIGQVSVDSATLTGGLGAGSFELRELFSGCVCCSLTGEMIETVRELESAISPEWLIIEATGLAVPKNAASVLREGLPELQGLLTVVLIDAARFLVLEKISPLVAEQAKGADILLINKMDLANEATRVQLIDKLALLNKAALSLEIVATEPIEDNIFMELIKRVK